MRLIRTPENLSEAGWSLGLAVSLCSGMVCGALRASVVGYREGLAPPSGETAAADGAL